MTCLILKIADAAFWSGCYWLNGGLSEAPFGDGIALSSSNNSPIKLAISQSCLLGLCCHHWAPCLHISSRYTFDASAFHTGWTQRNAISDSANNGHPLPMSPTPVSGLPPQQCCLALKQQASPAFALTDCHLDVSPACWGILPGPVVVRSLSCVWLITPHGLQHARLPCPSPTPRVCSNSCPLSQWYHPTISSSVAPFSTYPQPFPASGSFPMSWLFTSGSQSIGGSASASAPPTSIQGRSALPDCSWTVSSGEVQFQ